MNDIQKGFLVESARWQKLLGVVMMISSILIALLGIMYLLFAVLYYFFAVYLLRSAKAFKTWETSDDDAYLTEGLRNTKSFFRLSGILTIIGLCAIGLMLVGVVVTIAFTL